jgi:hypothetical protein
LENDLSNWILGRRIELNLNRQLKNRAVLGLVGARG